MNKCIAAAATILGILCWSASIPASSIPAPRDAPYIGAIRLDVDASDVQRRIFRVRESLPVRPGPLTLRAEASWLSSV